MLLIDKEGTEGSQFFLSSWIARKGPEPSGSMAGRLIQLQAHEQQTLRCKVAVLRAADIASFDSQAARSGRELEASRRWTPIFNFYTIPRLPPGPRFERKSVLIATDPTEHLVLLLCCGLSGRQILAGTTQSFALHVRLLP